MLSVWKIRLYGEHANVHQSHSQNDSGDLRGVARGDGELGCLCGKAGTSHLCDGSVHSSGCMVNGYGCLLIISHLPMSSSLLPGCHLLLSLSQTAPEYVPQSRMRDWLV